jgi:hypothetical protein
VEQAADMLHQQILTYLVKEVLEQQILLELFIQV